MDAEPQEINAAVLGRVDRDVHADPQEMYAAVLGRVDRDVDADSQAMNDAASLNAPAMTVLIHLCTKLG